jgi:hypothetical protein
MKNAIRHTLVFLLVGFFLVSFTGFRLLVHHCMGCEMTEIVFAGSPADCCHTEQGAETNSCCTENTDPAGSNAVCGLDLDSECCDLQTIYLKGDFDLVSERSTVKIEVPVLAAFVFVAETAWDQETISLVHGPTTFEDPPPRLTGRDFVLYSHQLKIS